MRDIDVIDEAMRELDPHWGKITADFEARNQVFMALMGRDHVTLGRILRCHLVVEHYIDQFLTHHLDGQDVREGRLSFHQKATLLPRKNMAVAFVRPGIIRLNKIRNGFGHSLDTTLAMHDLGPISGVLAIARRGATFGEPVDAIEAFTTVACTWLMVPDEELGEVMTRAFEKIQMTAE
jgi:hypothetical protein